MFDKQCWKADQTIKHCSTSKSKHNLWRDVFEKVQNIFCLTHAKNVGRAMFLEVAKRSNILPDKQISNVWPTMFDRLARALNPGQAIEHCFVNIWNAFVKQNVLPFGHVKKQGSLNNVWSHQAMFLTCFSFCFLEWVSCMLRTGPVGEKCGGGMRREAVKCPYFISRVGLLHA